MTYGRLFPKLKNTSSKRVDLDEAAKRTLAKLGLPVTSNPLLDPRRSQEMIDALHEELGVDWSWGSYLENRSHLLRGSYLDKNGNYLHLGIDCNFPAGTEICAPCECIIENLYDDRDTPCGWGPRVLLKLLEGPKEGEHVILSHFAPLTLEVGKKISRGELIGPIGSPPLNGAWWPHLHIQCLSPKMFSLHAKNSFTDLDGYGDPRRKEALREEFPDPFWIIEQDVIATEKKS